MVTITIDGKQISVDENLSILEAAQEADVKIPTLCYLKDVNEVGACKMCVVEVEGSRHLVTSCNTKVNGGVHSLRESGEQQKAGIEHAACQP